MKSPLTGKEMKLMSEPSTLNYRGKQYNVNHHFYLCELSNEQFTTTELDEQNLQELNKQVKLEFSDIRPWGFYEILLDTDYTKVKQITVNPGQKLSYQYHEKRKEYWTIVKGSATIILDDEKVFRNQGESIHIPLGSKHRIINESDEILVFIEVQTGESFDEDDIIRLEDDYGRQD